MGLQWFQDQSTWADHERDPGSGANPEFGQEASVFYCKRHSRTQRKQVPHHGASRGFGTGDALLTLASKSNIEYNSGIFDVSPT